MNIKDSYLHGNDEKGVIKTISVYQEDGKTKGLTLTRANASLTTENIEFGDIATNADSANKLATARNLGVLLSNTTVDAPFDGTERETNTEIPVSGILGVNNGGTGLSSIKAGSILYANANDEIKELEKNSTTIKKYLQSANGNPTWEQVSYNELSDVPTIPSGFLITVSDDILKGSNDSTNNKVKYSPYTTQQQKLSFDKSDTDPTLTTRLNLNGDFYATDLTSMDKVTVGTSGTSSVAGKGSIIIKQRGKANKQTTIQASTDASYDHVITLPSIDNTVMVAPAAAAANKILASNSTTAGDGKWIDQSDIAAGSALKLTNTRTITLSDGTNIKDNTGIDFSSNVTLSLPDNLKATTFTGNLVGNVTGDVTGDVTGNVNGDVTGNVTGNADTATNLSKTDLGVVYQSASNTTSLTKPTSGTAYLTGTVNGASFTTAWATPVTSFGSKVGAITLEAGNSTQGHIKLEMEGNQLKGSIEGWKNYTTSSPSSSSSDNTIPTSKAVYTAINNGIAEVDAMVYKGTLSGANITASNTYGALTPAADKGYTYKVSTGGYINGVKVEIGDMLICNTDNTVAATSSNYSTIKNNWDFIQANLDPTTYITKATFTKANQLMYSSTAGIPAVLDSNSTNTTKFLSSISSGVPEWSILTSSDIPNLDASKITSGILPVERGGTGVNTLADIKAGKDGNGNTITDTYATKAAAVIGTNLIVSASNSTTALSAEQANPYIVSTKNINGVTTTSGAIQVIGGTNITVKGEAGKVTINNSLSTKNLNYAGVNYSIYTSASSLPTIPEVKDTVHYIRLGEADTSTTPTKYQSTSSNFTANAANDVATYIPLANQVAKATNAEDNSGINTWGVVKGCAEGENGVDNTTGAWKKCRVKNGVIEYYFKNNQYTVNDGTLTLNVGGEAVDNNDQFTANSADNKIYNVPAATVSNYGVVKVASVRDITLTTSVGSTTGRYYGVGKTINGTLFVNIPWTDTKLTTTVTSGKMYIVGKTESDKETTSIGVYDPYLYVTNGALNATSLNTTAEIISGTYLKATTSLEVGTTSLLKGNVTLGTSSATANLIYNKGSYTGTLSPTTLSSNTAWTLPAVSGYLITSGTTNSAVGSSTVPVYISSNGVATACTLGAAANYAVTHKIASWSPQSGDNYKGLITESALSNAFIGTDVYKAETYDSLIISLSSSGWTGTGKKGDNSAYSIQISNKAKGIYLLMIEDVTKNTLFTGIFSNWHKDSEADANNYLDEIPLHKNSGGQSTSRIYAATQSGKIVFSCNGDNHPAVSETNPTGALEHTLNVTIKRLI